MTRPRSSGCTRTSSRLPRRSGLLRTWTSSGCATMPRTRCSRASTSTVSPRPAPSRRRPRPGPRSRCRRERPRPRRPRAGRLARLLGGLLGGGSASAGCSEACGVAGCSAWRLRDLAARPAAAQRAAPAAAERQPPASARRPAGSAAASARRRPLGVGRRPSARPSCGRPWAWSPPPRRESPSVSLAAAAKTAFLSARGVAVRRVPSAPGRPLNFCQSPVTLRIASTCSVGCAPTPSQYWARARVDLDVRGVLGGVVLADLLDGAAVALGARVGDDDAVVRGTDLAHALEADLDGHGGGSPGFVGVRHRCAGWGPGAGRLVRTRRERREGPPPSGTATHSARPRAPR